MKGCKDIHEAFWKAIRVKRMKKRYHLQNAKLQEEEFPIFHK